MIRWIAFLRNPYFWVASTTFMLFLPVLVILPEVNDLFVHAGTIEQLKADFWAPRDPMVNEPGSGNPYFSPYMVFWALISKALGMGAFDVLRVAGAVNILLLLLGIGSFVRTLTLNRWAPVTSLAAVFFMWGTRSFYWSGFISLPGLVASVVYPSTFAMGAGLLLCSWVSSYFRAELSMLRRFFIATGLVLGGSAVLMSHQFTALGVSTYAAIYVLRHWKRGNPRVWTGLALVIVCIAGIVWVWPWYNLFSASGGVESFNTVHRPLYEHLVHRYGLLFLAIPVLGYRLKKDRMDPVSITALLCLAAFLYGGASGKYFLARVFPMAALLSQIAVGVAVAQWLQAGQKKSAKIAGWVGIFVFTAGAVFQSGFVNLLSPGIYPPAMAKIFGSGGTRGSYAWITNHARPGDSIMTTTRQALIMAPGYGVYTVMPVWPDPTLGTVAERRTEDSLEFFKGATTGERRAQLMSKYSAQWVIVEESNAATFRADPNFVWIAERPTSSESRFVAAEQRQQLFEYVGAK